MALVVNTDTYRSLEDANTYFASRPHSSEWTDVSKSDAQRETALRFAAKHLDLSYEWAGVLYLSTQAMSWPRKDFYDNEGRFYDGTSVPTAIKDAQCELAFQWLWADQLTPDPTKLTRSDTESEHQVKREKLGPLEREYFEASGYLFDLVEGRLREKVYPLVDLMIRPFYISKIRNGIQGKLIL